MLRGWNQLKLFSNSGFRF